MNVMVPLEATDLTAWPIAPGALLLAGRARQPVPTAGIAQLERRQTDRGTFRAHSWSADDPAEGSAFIAAVRLPVSTVPSPGQSLTLESPTGGHITLRLPSELEGARNFAATAVQLVDTDKPRGAQLARFLFEILPPAAMSRLPAIGNMLAALFPALAVDDGCVELMGAIPGICGFLQGWGGTVTQNSQSPDGGVEALLVGDRVARCHLRIATFARPDIVMPATGMVLVADHASGHEPNNAGVLSTLPGLVHVYLLTDTALLRRVVVENRLLNPADSAGHLRDLLPSLTCAPAAADCLRRALRPRYEGRETLGEQPLPVRAAVDQALLLPPEPSGVPTCAYLTGWLFDPTNLVVEVSLCDNAGFRARLDVGWTRIARDDVTHALTREGFPPPPDDEHGFAAFAESKLAPDGPLHLDIAFRDGTCAFLPVTAASARDVTVRRRALEGTDLHKPSGLSVVERQLGPLFLALMRRPPNHGQTLAPLPKTNANATVPAIAMVVPLVGPPTIPRTFLSQFLHDPLAPDETLVLVCGAAWGPTALATLRRTVSFMNLNPRFVQAPEATDATAALDSAAATVPAESYLLLDAGTAGCRPGWRRTLRDASASAPPHSVICPTLVYEDLSVRYAGAKAITTNPVAPYVSVGRLLAGMPAALVDDGPPQPTEFGSLACCLVPRAVLSTIGGARTRLATDFGRETAFFLRLRSAGIACLWAPRAQVYAVEPAAVPAPGAAVSRLVDGWCLRAALETGLFTSKPTPSTGV
jgi:hypothetical protein